MPEPSENWLTVGSIVGTILAGIVLAFWRSYSSERYKERASAERSPEVAATAVGAAFVDRSAAQAIVEMAEVVKEKIEPNVQRLVDMAQERIEQDHDDRLERRILDKIKDRPA